MSVLLCKQNPQALRIKNFYGETCRDLAGRSPNPKLAETLETLERDDERGASAANNFAAKTKMGLPPSSTAAASAAVAAAAVLAASPNKKINEFAKPTALTLR